MRYALWMKKANIHALDGYTNGHGTQPRTTQIVRVPGCDTFQGRFLLMLIPKHQETILRSQQKISIIFNYLIWLVVWNIFSPIVGMMIQSDFHIFQRGLKPPIRSMILFTTLLSPLSSVLVMFCVFTCTGLGCWPRYYIIFYILFNLFQLFSRLVERSLWLDFNSEKLVLPPFLIPMMVCSSLFWILLIFAHFQFAGVRE